MRNACGLRIGTLIDWRVEVDNHDLPGWKCLIVLRICVRLLPRTALQLTDVYHVLRQGIASIINLLTPIFFLASFY